MSTPCSQATRLLLTGPPLKVTLRARIRSKASLIVGDIHVADRVKKREGLVSKVRCTQPMNLTVMCGYT